MSRVVVVQHLEPEGPARIAAELRDEGVEIDVVRVDLGEPVPGDLEGVDGLVVMGGPMSAGSDDGFPTRSAELRLLAGAVAAEVPTLGVCLGAQLLAVAAGGEIRPGRGPEIGWGPVELRASAAADPLFAGLPEELSALHWHGETYDLPPGAVRLASSSDYEEQAFRVGQCAWGLQFHLEVGPDDVAAFVATFPGDAEQARGGAPGIRAATPSALHELGPHRDVLLARFADLVVSRATTTPVTG